MLIVLIIIYMSIFCIEVKICNLVYKPKYLYDNCSLHFNVVGFANQGPRAPDYRLITFHQYLFSVIDA